MNKNTLIIIIIIAIIAIIGATALVFSMSDENGLNGLFVDVNDVSADNTTNLTVDDSSSDSSSSSSSSSKSPSSSSSKNSGKLDQNHMDANPKGMHQNEEGVWVED
ncbi:MAG: hypothetical protein MJ224_03850 [archaeon]|nr:hypothetical protein [archaeon]